MWYRLARDNVLRMIDWPYNSAHNSVLPVRMAIPKILDILSVGVSVYCLRDAPLCSECAITFVVFNFGYI